MQAPCGSLGGCSRGQGQVCVWEVRSHCHVDPGLEGSRAGLGGGLHQAGSQGEALEVGAGLHSTKSSARHPSPTPALGPRPYPHCSPGSHTLGIRAGGGADVGKGPGWRKGVRGARCGVWTMEGGTSIRQGGVGAGAQAAGGGGGAGWRHLEAKGVGGEGVGVLTWGRALRNQCPHHGHLPTLPAAPRPASGLRYGVLGDQRAGGEVSRLVGKQMRRVRGAWLEGPETSGRRGPWACALEARGGGFQAQIWAVGPGAGLEGVE